MIWSLPCIIDLTNTRQFTTQQGCFLFESGKEGVKNFKKQQYLEVRTADDRMLCKARVVEGDILLILKSAGKEMSVHYTEIPRLVTLAKERQNGQKKSSP